MRATITGMVLEVPLEEGASVIEANTFNDGTTIATVADMDDMIFEGKVDESEVGKISPGMDLLLTIGAIERPDPRQLLRQRRHRPRPRRRRDVHRREPAAIRRRRPLRRGRDLPQDFERRDVEVGLSDGIRIEVVSGLDAEDKIKNPSPSSGARS